MRLAPPLVLPALLESARGELASAAYRTWIHLSLECACARCQPPQRPGTGEEPPAE